MAWIFWTYKTPGQDQKCRHRFAQIMEFGKMLHQTRGRFQTDPDTRQNRHLYRYAWRAKKKGTKIWKKKPTTFPNNLEKIYIHIWIEYSSIRCTVIILQPKTAICTRSVKKWGKKNDSFSQNFLFGFDLLEIPLSISFSKTQQYLLPVLSEWWFSLFFGFYKPLLWIL